MSARSIGRCRDDETALNRWLLARTAPLAERLILRNQAKNPDANAQSCSSLWTKCRHGAFALPSILRGDLHPLSATLKYVFDILKIDGNFRVRSPSTPNQTVRFIDHGLNPRRNLIWYLRCAEQVENKEDSVAFCILFASTFAPTGVLYGTKTTQPFCISRTRIA